MFLRKHVIEFLTFNSVGNYILLESLILYTNFTFVLRKVVGGGAQPSSKSHPPCHLYYLGFCSQIRVPPTLNLHEVLGYSLFNYIGEPCLCICIYLNYNVTQNLY